MYGNPYYQTEAKELLEQQRNSIFFSFEFFLTSPYIYNWKIFMNMSIEIYIDDRVREIFRG